MAADQIFILVLLLACIVGVAWMNIHSQREAAKRPKPPAAPPPPEAPRDRKSRR